MPLPYSMHEETLAERATDSKVAFNPPPVVKQRMDESYINEDWWERQRYLDLLDEEDLLNMCSKQCKHLNTHMGKTKLHNGMYDVWESGVVCSTCGILVQSDWE